MNADSDPAARLRIGGYQPFTTVDYPGALAAVVFCQGCPLRCVYCHNRDLLPARGATRIEWREVHAHLARRKGLLDAVVFSGGEPLMQAALFPAMTAAKSLGYRIGLHTSGIAPDRVREILPLLDWVGFDVKAPFDQYEVITGIEGSGRKARRSLEILMESGIDVEIRTTVWPGAADRNSIRQIGEVLSRIGVWKYVLQEARDPFTNAPMGSDAFADSALVNALREKFTEFTTRRAVS